VGNHKKCRIKNLHINIITDQDSDSIYTTNQSDIVKYARHCYLNYPTIVNNIPKEIKKYDNTLLNYAKIDNLLSASQTIIGESSNLAQIALSYSYNFNDEKYKNAVSILSVLAQVAIDSSKRRFDVDLVKEVKRIKKELDVTKNGLPRFWKFIKQDFNKNNINYELDCPMNQLCELKLQNAKFKKDSLPLSYFFIKITTDIDKKKCKKVEELIQKYSLNLYNSRSDDEENQFYIQNFDDLLLDIKRTYLSNNYLDLMCFLIDKIFGITQSVKLEQKYNRPLLLNVLYHINPNGLLKIFSKNSVL